MPDDKEPPLEDSIEVKLAFRVPQRMPTVYAHHMIVQPSEYEVLLSFFEVMPPLIVPQQKAEQIKRIQDAGIVAECVARITIAKDRFPSFAKAMQDILSVVSQTGDEPVQQNANDTRNNPEG